MSGSTAKEDLPIAVISLSKHARGEWITRLLEALRARGARVELILLEELFAWEDGALPWRAVVNRVSDAADPADCKAAQAPALCAPPTPFYS